MFHRFFTSLRPLHVKLVIKNQKIKEIRVFTQLIDRNVDDIPFIKS